MADAARLVIEIDDRTGATAPVPSGGVSPPSQGFAAAGRALDRPESRPGTAPGGSAAGAPAGRSYDQIGANAPNGGGGYPPGSGEPGDGPYRERPTRVQQALRGVGPGGRSYEQLAKDALAAAGRPADAADDEWLWYSQESGRRGQAAGRAAAKGAAARKKQQEEFEKYLAGAKGRVRLEEDQLQQAADDKAERERLAKEQRHATYAGAAVQGASGWMKGQAGAAEQAGGAIGGSLGMIAGEMFGGPIGAAIGQVIGKEVGEKIGARIDDPFLELTNTFDTLTKGAKFAGQSLVQIAGNDGVGLLVNTSEAAADALERVPVAGKAAAAGLRLFGATVGEAKAVLDAFAARGKELSGYNSALAGSVARQDVALLLADIREADKLGAKLSKVIDAQTKLELLVRELLLPIKLFVADRLPAAIDRGLDGTTALLKLLEFSNPLFVATFGKMSEDLERMRRAAEAGVAGADPLAMWFGGLGAVTGPAAPAPAMAPAGPLPAPVAAFPPP